MAEIKKREKRKQKERKRGRLAEAVLNAIGEVILAVVLLCCIPLTLPRLAGYEIYEVISGSMEPAIPTGSLVYVEGSLQTRKWQDQNGQDRYTTEIKAQRVQFLDREM